MKNKIKRVKFPLDVSAVDKTSRNQIDSKDRKLNEKKCMSVNLFKALYCLIIISRSLDKYKKWSKFNTSFTDNIPGTNKRQTAMQHVLAISPPTAHEYHINKARHMNVGTEQYLLHMQMISWSSQQKICSLPLSPSSFVNKSPQQLFYGEQKRILFGEMDPGIKINNWYRISEQILDWSLFTRWLYVLVWF